MLAVKQITTPDLGGAHDVTVIEVLVKPGQKIEKDDSIIVLESDKATLEVPATLSGTIQEIKVKVGDKVSTGSILLTVEGESKGERETPKRISEEKANLPSPSTEAAPATTPKLSLVSENQSVPLPSSKEESLEASPFPLADIDIHAGPGVRRLARELGVNLANVVGNGPKQRILKEDIHAYVKQQLQSPGREAAAPFNLPSIDFSQFGPIEALALSRIKKISGKNLQRNWSMIPHVTQFGDADITELEIFRQSQKAAVEKNGVKLTPLVFIMKAVVATLEKFPPFNASLDVAQENLILKKYFHIGVAVDTPDGLVVPVIRNVDKKGLRTLAKELAEISEKARQKKLTLTEMQGGCFSISSLGGIGGTAFTPIINYPEVAILGVSKACMRPYYHEGNFVPRLMLPLSLSYDHRVIDGAQGARFLTHLVNLLGDIRELLL